MKTKLEERKNELLKYLGYQNEQGLESHLGEHFRKGFDLGISAYKEMLNESVEVKLDRNSIEQNVVEKWSEHWYDPKINEQDTANYRRRILSVDANMRYSIARMMSEYVQPVLAKLQQQAEKIEELEKWQSMKREQLKDCAKVYHEQQDKITELESRLKEHEDNGLVIYGRKIELLTARLKEAESVIGFYADKQTWFDMTKYISDDDYDAATDRVYGGKLARQYMEKVK
jgi:hypothetical protein